MPDFRIEGESVSFWLKVKPRSRHEKLAVANTGELCLDVSAPPVEGRANEACVRFFSRELRLPQACVVVLRGKQSRRKLVRITGRTAKETVVALKALAAGKGARRSS